MSQIDMFSLNYFDHSSKIPLMKNQNKDSLMKGIKIVFNGHNFYRYPNSKSRSRRKYYVINKHVTGITTLHREVWKFHNGEIPEGFHIHHIDGDTDNNHISNLQCISLLDHGKLHQSDNDRKKNSLRIKNSWKKREKFKINCIYCKNEFDTYWSKSSKYCSGNCATKARNKSKVDFIEANCVVCNNKFKTRKYRSAITCSRLCADKKASETKELKKYALL